MPFWAYTHVLGMLREQNRDVTGISRGTHLLYPNNQGIISKVGLEEATLPERRRLMLPRTSLVMARYVVPHSREADRVERRLGGGGRGDSEIPRGLGGAQLG